MKRLRIEIEGRVQGVGFRPFVFRLAEALGLGGFVCNTGAGVCIEVEGPRAEEFLARLHQDRPTHAVFTDCRVETLEVLGATSFSIKASQTTDRMAQALPDLATCKPCVQEILDPKNRRFGYAFTTCSDCGPRYSILDALPYDREHTAMRLFPMCEACLAEYQSPADRRFHAEGICCAKCGPSLALWNGAGQALVKREDALLQATARLKSGQIVAMKGLGGFQLLVDAQNPQAIQRLRLRKHRPDKPLAVMFPDLHSLKEFCVCGAEDEALLLSVQAPIVLLPAKGRLPDAIAPNNPLVGAFLPYTPLHHLLMAQMKGPLVATSGNISGEPICVDEHEALQRLTGLADIFLVHNRPIQRAVDDSVVRMVAGRPLILRLARGYAPLAVSLSAPLPEPALAVGGHLKSAIAFGAGRHAILGPHIGDLDTELATNALQSAFQELGALYGFQPKRVVCDLHPDYASSRIAEILPGQSLGRAQHHRAHLLACMADNAIQPPFLGVAWDGTGLGEDGTIWGGEFFLADAQKSAFFMRRIASFWPFRLPGGDLAARQPWRIAQSMLFELFGREAIAPHLRPMLEQGIASPYCSSVGRLFDGVASLLGLRNACTFEGQAAIELEFIASDDPMAYPMVSERLHGLMLLDWRPMLWQILQEQQAATSAGVLSARFHRTLAHSIVLVAQEAKVLFGEGQNMPVLLTGGCFQNKRLTEMAIQSLQDAGFQAYWHHKTPPNDGSLALGQLISSNNPIEASKT